MSPVSGFRPPDESLVYLCYAVSKEDGSFSFYSLPSGGYTVVSALSYEDTYEEVNKQEQSLSWILVSVPDWEGNLFTSWRLECTELGTEDGLGF